MEGCMILKPVEPQDPVERIEKIILPELKEAMSNKNLDLMEDAIMSLDVQITILSMMYKINPSPKSKRLHRIMEQLQKDFNPQQKKPKNNETQDLKTKEGSKNNEVHGHE